MSFSAYPEYKNSGFDWLGLVPSHWEIKPLWTMFRRVKRTNMGTEELLSVYRDHGVIPKSSRDDNNNRASEDLEPYQLVNIGDLVVNKMKAWQGSVAISKYRGIVSPAYFVYEATHHQNPQYLHYLMRSDNYITAYFSISKGIRVNQWDLEAQYHSRLPLLLPPAKEQQEISDFLDYETNKIDSLMSEQAKLIELLKEKRKTEISHVMCVGLTKNRRTRMPSTGSIEREIAEDWQIIRFKNLLSIPFMYGANEAAELDDPDWPRFIRITDIKENGDLKSETFKSLPPDIAEPYLLKDEDILLARSGGTVGKSFIYRSEWGACCFAGYLIRARLIKSKCLPKWFYYYSQTSMYWDFIQGEQIQATIQNVSAEKYGNIQVPLPSVDEQAQIISYVELIDSKYRNLISEIEKQSVHLQEHRSALIASAVTGQIDVRSTTDKLEAV